MSNPDRIIKRLAHLKDTHEAASDLANTATDFFNKECWECPHRQTGEEEAIGNTYCGHTNNEVGCCCIAFCPLVKKGK